MSEYVFVLYYPFLSNVVVLLMPAAVSRCLIIDDQKWCVCRHDLQLDKKYIKVGKVCMNAQKYYETRLDANELQAVTAQIPEDYQTEEMQQMHELVDERE